jgi:ATP-binding cassette subfamily B protein
MVASTILGLLKPWPLKFLFDQILTPVSMPDAETIAWWLALIGGAIVLIAALNGFFSYLKVYLLKEASQRIAFSLRVALFSHVQSLSLTYHDRQRTGDLITRVTGDVDKVQDLVTDDLLKSINQGLTLVGMGIIMLRMDWQLALMVLTALPVLFGIVIHYRARIRDEERRLRHKIGEIASLAQETLSSIKVVQAYGRERHIAEQFEEHTQEALDAGLHVSRLGARFGWLANISTALGTALVVIVGTQRVLSGALTPGDLLVFLSYVKDFYSPMRTLSKLTTKLSRTMVRLNRVTEVLAEEPGVQEDPNAQPAPPFQGYLRFEGVTFGYEAGRPVLLDIDFNAEPGQVVAIVGPTGVGKSTLVSLVPRLYDPTVGRVLIDGHDIREFTLASLRAQIAVVLQETMLFRATVRENIAYGRPEASVAEVEAAAKAAGAHGFILNLPEGYDTMLGERGSTLSGGQRQRIAIARALIRNAPLLILDEPTTGLDAQSEAELLAALERLMVGRTTLLITHQLRLVRRADLILVLEGGRIVERGSHNELLGRGGLYARLYATQFGTGEIAWSHHSLETPVELRVSSPRLPSFGG